MSLSLSLSGTHAAVVYLLSGSRAGLRAELRFTAGHKQRLHTLVSTGNTPAPATHTTARGQSESIFPQVVKRRNVWVTFQS